MTMRLRRAADAVRQHAQRHPDQPEHSARSESQARFGGRRWKTCQAGERHQTGK
jgi:hypothetical protein